MVFDWNVTLWILREHQINSWSLKPAGITLTELMFCVSLLQMTSISVFDSLVILMGLLINCFKLNDESIAFSSL